MRHLAPSRRRVLRGVAVITAVGAGVGVNTEMASAAIRTANVFIGVPSNATLPECVRVATTKTADGFYGDYTSSIWADYSPSPVGQPCNNTPLPRNGGSLTVLGYKGYNNTVTCYSSEARADNLQGQARATASVSYFAGCPTTGNFSRAFGQYWNPYASYGNPSNSITSPD